MSNEIVKADWQNQIALVKSMVARGATDEEFALMSHIAVKYQLDPLVKQIWVVKYGDAPASIFTGRDGFLSIAHRTGQFNGIETVVEKVSQQIHVSKTRYDKWKKEKVTIEVKRDWQYKAVCTVRRKDAEFPFIVEVYEEEYTTGENLWTSKPRTMLGKVAESQCLRKAFDIAGLYSPEEMPEPHEKELNPVSTAQAEFEKKKGITPQHGDTPDVEPTPDETADQKKKRELGEQRAAIMNAMPKDIQEYFIGAKKTMKLGEWFKMVSDNNTDPELIRGWIKDHPLVEVMTGMPTQGEESMP